MINTGDPRQQHNYWRYPQQTGGVGGLYEKWTTPYSGQWPTPFNQHWPLKDYTRDGTSLGGWSDITLKLAAEKAELEEKNDELEAELAKLKGKIEDRDKAVECLSDCLEETQDELSALTRQVHKDDLELDKLAIHLVENYLDLMDKCPQESASDVDLAIFVMEQLEEEARFANNTSEFHSDESLKTVDFYENIIRDHGERLKEYFVFTDDKTTCDDDSTISLSVYDGLEYSNKLVEVFHAFAHKLCKILREQGGEEFYQEHIGQDICKAFEELLKGKQQMIDLDVDHMTGIIKVAKENKRIAEEQCKRANELEEQLEAVEPVPDLEDLEEYTEDNEPTKCHKCDGKGLVKNVFGKYRPCPDC